MSTLPPPADQPHRVFGTRVLVLSLVLAGLLGPAAAPRVNAQPGFGGQPVFQGQPSQPLQKNRPKYEKIAVDGDFEAAMKDLLEDAKNQKQFDDQISKILKKLQDSKDFKIDPELLKKIDLEDPDTKKKIKQVQDNPEFKKIFDDPNKKEEFKKIFKIDPPNDPKVVDPIKPDPVDPPVPPNPPPIPPPPHDPIAPPPEQPVPEPEEDWLGQGADRWLEGLDNSGVGQMLLESQAFRNLVLELKTLSPEQKQSLWGLESKDFSPLLERMPNFDWKNPLPNTGMKLGNFRIPNLPRMNWRPPSVGGVGGAGAVGASAGTLSAGGAVFLAVLLVAVAAIVVLLLTRARWAGTVTGQRGWHLGPWPVDPARIATRAELVRAFNYLAFLLLGRQAEHFNHRAVAEQIGDTAAERQPVADALARLYEHARYAPADEDLSSVDLQQARRDLCLLAGAARA